jgi:hypothetical protein
VSEWTEALVELREPLGDVAITPALLAEADAVGGCIERSVAGELDPTGELALGRYPPFLLPGAGAWLTKKRKYDASPASRAALAFAVRRTLAVGWFLGSSLEMATVVPGRSERDIYNIWAPGFKDAPSNVVGKEMERTIHHVGADAFVAALRDSGMTRALGGSKVRQIGYVISGGGFMLRVIQSAIMGEAEFSDAADLWAKMIAENAMGRARWAWEVTGA